MKPWQAWGLSPRVRGNRAYQAEPDVEKGSIPACAGEPGRYSVSREAPVVYPRVCGGTAGRLPHDMAVVGLSPRVRGNHNGKERNVLSDGSIPACAGEPQQGRPTRRRIWVYPRVCGGTNDVATPT